MIKVENLSKIFKSSKKFPGFFGSIKGLFTREYTEKVAVNDISFEIAPGDIVGYIGSNGAGKSTTIKIMTGILTPTSGTVLVDGYDISKEPDIVRSKIGFLTCELKLEDFFTPEYLFDFFSSLRNVDPKLANERKERLFKKFGIDTFREVKIKDLSTGMKQKISLVIAIAHDPEIVIFDEPTNGLDIVTSKTVTDFLLELKKEGKTIVLSTHIFSLVEKLCDRVGIVMDGKMIKEDTLENLTANKCLEDVFFDLYDEFGGKK